MTPGSICSIYLTCHKRKAVTTWHRNITELLFFYIQYIEICISQGSRWYLSSNVFFWVLLWAKDDNVTFGEKDAGQETKAWCQNGKYLHSNGELPRAADISWNKCDPDSAEDQHAEGDEFGLIKAVWQFPGEKRKNKTQDCKNADVGQDSPESNSWTQGTLQDNLFLIVFHIPLWKRRVDSQPEDAD